jgi:conjugal transfer pilus assembly protein TraV
MTSSRLQAPAIARQACRALVCSGVLALCGCASLAGVGGSAEFGCKAPVGVKCDSVSGTYYNALQQNLPSQQKGPSATPEPSLAPPPMDQRMGKRAAPLAYTRNSAARANMTMATPAATQELNAPLRSAPRVLRLWIKHWEDSDGDLHSQSYVYVPIDAGRWLIDHYRPSPRQAYAPIKAPRPLTRAVSSPGTAATPDSPRTWPDDPSLLGAPSPATPPPSGSDEEDSDGR